MLQAYVFGHSICRRLRECIESGCDPRMRPDFKLDSQMYVNIVGRGGLRLQQLVGKDGAGSNYLRKIFRTAPDVVILQLGGNGFRFAEPMDAEEFALTMLAFAGLLHGIYKVKQVVVCGILPRFSPTADYRGSRGLSATIQQRYHAWARY
ncbi:hypothetical protein V1264_008750 [Littorina saxatilis]|uniref:SGNH hydrolase-type esterase domain-containing protein n=1 Tax=Littorina saxatilis TaxID=31220 RepID=A0AAN9AV26_9CAEN